MRERDDCPVCGASEISAFYRIAGVPVHQHLLHESAEDAIACERGDIVLGACGECGFVFNRAFEPGLVAYSDRYDNSQAHSPVFSAYMRDVAERLVERYDLHGKRLIEVGCGQGEFLELLCELGPNTGVGFDPAYPPGEHAREGVEFVREFYSDRHRDHEADFFYLRHVLEHIPDPHDLLGTIRRSIGDRLGTPIFIEVPSVTWILREASFWDVFYEHCSLYSPGSLTRLLGSDGFDVSIATESFGGQYLAAEGVAADGAQPQSGAAGEVADLAAGFEQRCTERRDAIAARIDDLATKGRSSVLWGAGAKGVTLLNRLGDTAGGVAAVVDLNPRKQGSFVAGTGHEIVAPESLRSSRPDAVLFTNPNYREEIAAALAALGLESELVPVHD